MTKGRHLRDDEKKIWQRVARTVRPLSETKPPVLDDSYVRLHGAHAPAPLLHHTPNELRPRVDKAVRRGKIEVDAKIDLHDLTRDEAFPKLVRRIERAFEKQHRTLLVVTGKGTNLEGVLRKSLVGWLSEPGIRPMVAGYAQAHIRHGGTGAFYVFLKRKKG